MTIDFRYRDIIKKDNDEVLRKMRTGQSLATIKHEATWYPPRPKIKKDPEALQFVHRKESPLRLVD